MKIVHIMNWYIPKMGYQENFLPREQGDLGHDVQIITSDRIPQFLGYERHIGKLLGDRIIGCGIYEDKGVKIHRLPVLFEAKDSSAVLLGGLKNKLKILNPDIIHSHGALCPLTLQSILYKKSIGYKIFVDDHSNEDNLHLNSITKISYHFFAKCFYKIYSKNVSFWMPVTYASKAILIKNFGIPEEKMELMPLGVDSNRFYRSKALRNLGRNRLGLDKDEFLIISTGKFNLQKDIDILIKSVAEVKKKWTNIKLLLIGGGSESYMDKLKSLVNYSRLKDTVIFIDFVDNSELPLYYNSADLGIWPGTNSITVIEAIATGLPVIIPEHDKSYGILFKSSAAIGFKRGEVKELSKSIIKLIEDDDLRKDILSASLELVSKELMWSAIANKSINIYNQ